MKKMNKKEKELYESLCETLEIMADPEFMRDLRKSIQQIDEGKTIPWEQVKSELFKKGSQRENRVVKKKPTR